MPKDTLDKKIWQALEGLTKGRKPTTTPRQLMLRIGKQRRRAEYCQEIRERLEENNLRTMPDFETCDFHARIELQWIDPVRGEEERKAVMAIAENEQRARELIESELTRVYLELQEKQKRDRRSLLSRILDFFLE